MTANSFEFHDGCFIDFLQDVTETLKKFLYCFKTKSRLLLLRQLASAMRSDHSGQAMIHPETVMLMV